MSARPHSIATEDKHMRQPDAPGVGERAPEFSLPASTGGEVSLDDFAGDRPVVLYFYPKDDTPGCTKEACSFHDLGAEFERAGAAIVGVSTGALDSHRKFAAKHGLPFPLLSDTEAAVSRAYGVYKEKAAYGRKRWGIERTTFVIDKQGIVRKVYKRVQVEEHAQAVLNFIREHI